MERIGTAFLGLVATGFGFIILIGGAVRFPPPTYQPLLEATGGRVWPYAVLYLSSGFLLILGHRLVTKMIGAALGVVAHSVFSALFLVAVFLFPEAGATAWWAYASFATANAALGALMWTHRKRPNREG